MEKEPNPIPKKLKEFLLKNIPSGLVDGLTKFIHDSWWEQKKLQGFHHPSEKHKEWDENNPKKICDKCDLDMIPYSKLPDSSKILDKITIENTLAGLRLFGYHVHPNPNKKKFNLKNWSDKEK